MIMTRAPLLRSVTALLAIFALAGCQNTDGPVGPDADGPSPSPSPTPSTSTGTIRVTNSTASSIWFVYFSPCASTSWGVDRLGEDVILSGNFVQWTSIAAGCWDVKAVLDNGREATRLGMTVSRGAVAEWRPSTSAFSRTVDVREPLPALSVRGTKPVP